MATLFSGNSLGDLSEPVVGIRQMNLSHFSHRLMVMLTAFFTLALTARMASAQSARQLESELSSLQGQMGAAESNPSTPDQAIIRLDAADGNFPKLTSTANAPPHPLI